MNLESVLTEEIRVTVGGVACEVSVSTESDTDEVSNSILRMYGCMYVRMYVCMYVCIIHNYVVTYTHFFLTV